MIDPKNVPVFILAGGMGTRLSEETNVKPKPMVEVGGIPILLHIMRSYYAHGFSDFVICAGYRAWDIKEFFLHYQFRLNHLSIDHRNEHHSSAKVFSQNTEQERWRVRVIDTGLETMTGARIAKAFDHIQDESFSHMAVTYGDGLCDVDLSAELVFHEKHGKIGTILGVKPVSRFGELEVDSSGAVTQFAEKPDFNQSLINGGFFFFKRDFRKYLSLDPTSILERQPLEALAKEGHLKLYEHRGFWQCMDTLRDKTQLQSLWDRGQAPWVKKRGN